jgi:alpha-L-rhamnosidase
MPYIGPEGFLEERQHHIVMPPAFVNTYFKIKSMQCMSKIARIIGKDEESELYSKRAATTFEHFKAIYYDVYNRTYFNNIHGACAFAIDIGHDDARTTNALADYYKRQGYLDTGIFGTDIVPRVLFEKGFGEIAIDLLTSDKEISYENWRRLGATTFWEYWHNGYDRSHSHPMFGAPTAYLFEYLLGIKQNEDSAGFTAVTISPVITDKVSTLSGSILTPRGKISVSYVKDSGEIRFSITVPEGTDARFTLGENDYHLSVGENEFTVKI